MNVAQWRQRATGRYPVPNRYVLVPVLDCNADEQAILCSEITGNVVLRAPWDRWILPKTPAPIPLINAAQPRLAREPDSVQGIQSMLIKTYTTSSTCSWREEGGVGGAGWLRCGCGFCKRMCNTFLYSPAGSQPLIILNLFTYAAASTCAYILVCVCVPFTACVCVCRKSANFSITKHPWRPNSLCLCKFWLSHAGVKQQQEQSKQWSRRMLERVWEWATTTKGRAESCWREGDNGAGEWEAAITKCKVWLSVMNDAKKFDGTRLT